MLSALLDAIIWPLTVIRTTLAISLMGIAASVPIIKDKIKRYNEKHFLVPYENFWQSWCSCSGGWGWEMLKSFVLSLDFAPRIFQDGGQRNEFGDGLWENKGLCEQSSSRTTVKLLSLK